MFWIYIYKVMPSEYEYLLVYMIKKHKRFALVQFQTVDTIILSISLKYKSLIRTHMDKLSFPFLIEKG